MEHEVWLPVIGYEGIYWASNLGSVRKGVSGIILKPSVTSGRPHLSLSKDGVVRSHRLHVVILSSFCGPRPFKGAHCAHNDGNPLNCRLDNLRWATPAENQADRVRHGTDIRGSMVYGSVLKEGDVAKIKCRIRSGERNPSIAKDFKVSVSTIHLIRHMKTWRHVK